MAARIRLKRTGTRNAACYRIVVADPRSQRDGRVIEELGFYDPRHTNEKLDLARAEYWLSCGAKASETVMSIVNRAKNGLTLTPPDAKRAKRQQKKAEKKAAEAAAAQQPAPASAGA
jgi:small subunit ribosomal protein S16